MKLTLTYVKTFPPKGKQKSDTLSLKCQEYGDRYISGFLDKDDVRRNWKAGQQVEWEVVENGQYLNLAKPAKKDVLDMQPQLDNIYKALDAIGDKDIKQDERLDHHAQAIKKLTEMFHDLEAKVLSKELEEDLDNETADNPL